MLKVESVPICKKLNSMALSKIEIANDTMTYTIKKISTSIKLIDIEKIEATKASMSKSGLLIVKANDKYHNIPFLATYNKDILDFC